MVAVTEVSLCNRALDMIGEKTISALTEENESARACSRHYEQTRDELQAMHPWAFSKEYAELAKLTETPIYWKSYFRLPSDFNQMRFIVDDPEERIKYEILSDDRLGCDEGTLKICYSKLITDPTKFSPLYNSTLVPLLASRIAPKLTDSNTRKQSAFGEYQYFFNIATSGDSQQDNTDDKIERSDWNDARY